MPSDNGTIYRFIYAIALLLILAPQHEIKCQDRILDSAFSFRAGIMKTGNALNFIKGEVCLWKVCNRARTVAGLSSSRWYSSPPQESHTPALTGGLNLVWNGVWQLRQIQRPASRETNSSSDTLM